MSTRTTETLAEETSTLEDLAALCENRAATYDLLSRLYRVEVDEPLLAEMKAMRFPASTGSEHMDAGYRLIATYLSNVWENSLEELAVDYTRTFIGNGIDALSAAYPFESVYTSEKRLMMQDARDEVLAVYRAYGLDKRSEWREGEDHIALELEFMKTLSQRAADALAKGDEERAEGLLVTQKNFLADHLSLWVPLFTSDVTKHAKTDFYQGLASLTKGFLAVDAAFLNELTAEDPQSPHAGDDE